MKCVGICILLVFGTSCFNNNKPVEPKVKSMNIPELAIPDTLVSGVLYPEIKINNDVLNTFALYLPYNYSEQSVWPVVFFFDSGGHGALPVDKYKSIADSLGYVLIGSNVFKNGMEEQEAVNYWNTLKLCAQQNFRIAKERIILAGFSGGARICCALASYDKSVQGVIANSAGAAQLEILLGDKTCFIGICGKRDMNRAEMLGIEQHLSGTSIKHYFIEFDGIHKWAPKTEMKKAITIMSLHAYSNNPSILNPTICEEFISEEKAFINMLLSKNRLVEAYSEIGLLKSAVTGISTTEIPENDSLKENRDFILQRNEQIKIISVETTIQQELLKMIQENTNEKEWANKIDAIGKNAKLKSEIGQMNQRLLGYASLLCYSFCHRSLLAKNYEAASKIVKCYELADPENAEVYYFNSIICASQKDKINTIANLNKAKSFGFREKKRIIDQSEFSFLIDDSDFVKLIAE